MFKFGEGTAVYIYCRSHEIVNLCRQLALIGVMSSSSSSAHLDIYCRCLELAYVCRQFWLTGVMFCFGEGTAVYIYRRSFELVNLCRQFSLTGVMFTFDGLAARYTYLSAISIVICVAIPEHSGVSVADQYLGGLKGADICAAIREMCVGASFSGRGRGGLNVSADDQRGSN